MIYYSEVTKGSVEGWRGWRRESTDSQLPPFLNKNVYIGLIYNLSIEESTGDYPKVDNKSVSKMRIPPTRHSVTMIGPLSSLDRTIFTEVLDVVTEGSHASLCMVENTLGFWWVKCHGRFLNAIVFIKNSYLSGFTA